MQIVAYRGYTLTVLGLGEVEISQSGERISSEPSSARARAAIDEWLNAR